MKVSELLNTPDRWTQGVYARTAMGQAVPAEDTQAARWCLAGAIERCYGLAGLPGPWNAIAGRVGMTPGQWNDDPRRTFAEVRALVVDLDI